MRLSLIISASFSAAATIPHQADNTCSNPAQRVEWRTMSAETRKQYIDAVLCLKTKPSGIGLNTSRYDDFPYVHTKLDKTSEFLLSFHSILEWREFVGTDAEIP